MAKKVTVVWTQEALNRLAEIQDFIAKDNKTRAEEFVNLLIKKGDSIFENSARGRIVPEISNPKIRELLVKSYRIVYGIQENTIEILTVFEGHKLLNLDNLNF